VASDQRVRGSSPWRRTICRGHAPASALMPSSGEINLSKTRRNSPRGPGHGPPPIPIRHHGSVEISREDGRWIVRSRVRDLDGVKRRGARWGTRAGAQQALNEDSPVCAASATRCFGIPHASGSRAAAVWSAKFNERREDSTADTFISTGWTTSSRPPRRAQTRISAMSPALMCSLVRWRGLAASSMRTARRPSGRATRRTVPGRSARSSAES
jgi:hypothetical protein